MTRRRPLQGHASFESEFSRGSKLGTELTQVLGGSSKYCIENSSFDDTNQRPEYDVSL